jgi:hypothetical protein
LLTFTCVLPLNFSCGSFLISRGGAVTGANEGNIVWMEWLEQARFFAGEKGLTDVSRLTRDVRLFYRLRGLLCYFSMFFSWALICSGLKEAVISKR